MSLFRFCRLSSLNALNHQNFLLGISYRYKSCRNSWKDYLMEVMQSQDALILACRGFLRFAFQITRKSVQQGKGRKIDTFHCRELSSCRTRALYQKESDPPLFCLVVHPFFLGKTLPTPCSSFSVMPFCLMTKACSASGKQILHYVAKDLVIRCAVVLKKFLNVDVGDCCQSLSETSVLLFSILSRDKNDVQKEATMSLSKIV